MLADRRDDPIDGVVVINLDRRPGRWEQFKATWRDHLDWSRVHRLPAIDGRALAGALAPPWFRGRRRDATWAGRAGCALSHAAAWRMAEGRGWTRTLVLEDDAVPSDNPFAALRRADPSWDLLYLGCGLPRWPGDRRQDGVTPIEGALDLHAYVVNASARDRLVGGAPTSETIWPWIARERAVDRWIDRKAGIGLAVGCLWPPHVSQRADASDITQRGKGDAAPSAALDSRASRPLWRRRLEAASLDIGDRARAAAKRLVGF